MCSGRSSPRCAGPSPWSTILRLIPSSWALWSASLTSAAAPACLSIWSWASTPCVLCPATWRSRRGPVSLSRSSLWAPARILLTRPASAAGSSAFPKTIIWAIVRLLYRAALFFASAPYAAVQIPSIGVIGQNTWAYNPQKTFPTTFLCAYQKGLGPYA